MRFSDDFLENLRSRNDIEQSISSYVRLKHNGRTSVGLCPFHSEKTPSFTVYSDTQSYYCFGCGAGGDVITFVRTIENLDYQDAVRFLAEKSGLNVPSDGYDDTVNILRRRLLEANREAAKFYHRALYSEKGRQALDYLRGRSLDGDIITRFGLGFAPDEWDGLIKHMASAGFSKDELLQAGLARNARNGGAYDFFRNRVMFPIIDTKGTVTAFGGRVMDDSMPKYLNSPETAAFSKSYNLFGLNFAKAAKDGFLLLTEGYMDVISLHQNGITNAVATLGTALTAEQARIIKRMRGEAVIAYDSDEAGQKA
ncbi:MAG: DNA primase, partial [Oscillospiraceae bacterium]|nr:DNA primase [Oscillospiraceae bacterium]